jgi:hypothetical protein
MHLAVKHSEQLAKLASETSCYANHRCLESGLEDLTEVQVAAEGRVLFCFSKNADRCGHSQSFGRAMLCECPVRQYIAQHLGR